MALTGFTIAGTPNAGPSAPAPSSNPSGSALAGFSIGASAPPVAKTPAAPAGVAAPTPIDTSGFYSKTLSTLGISGLGKTAASTPATAAEAAPDNFGIQGPVFKATVGEGLAPDAAATARDTVQQAAAQAPGQDIKVPFVDAAISVPKANADQGGIGGGNGVYDQFKSFIEAPEKAARSLTELVGATKPDSGTRQARYTVPSYAESAGKTTGQLIDEGVSPTLSVILASGASAGEFANDALMYEGFLAGGVRAIAAKAVVPAESELVAWDLLGRPKTLEEAETNWRAIQREHHPDITGSDKVSADANNAIAIMRKEGIPTTSKLNQAIDAITNRPVQDLFKKSEVPGGYKPETPIKGFLEGQTKSAAAKEVLSKEIKTYSSAHGPDVARQALIDNLGIDVRTADRLVTEAIAARTPRQVAAASRDILAEIAPETAKAPRTASTALQGFKVEGQSTVRPEPVVKPAPAVKKPIKDSLTAYDTRAIIKTRAEIASKKPTHLIDTPKRRALRAKIIDDVYRKHAPKKGKRLDIVTGIPASGKSSNIVAPLAKEHQALVTDSDEMKKLLPGYAKGKGAMAVHQESAVMNFDLIKKGLDGGDNIVYPTVGANEKALNNLIDLAHSKGYEIHLHNVDLAPEKAAQRAVDRFKKTGRLVDPDYIINKVGLRSHETHAIVKGNEKLTSVTRYNADVPKGRRYPVVEQGTPGDAARRGNEESERLGGDVHGGKDERGTEEVARIAEEAPPENVERPTIADTQVPLSVPTGEGDFATPKLAERIQDRLDETFEGVPQYEKMSMKDEANIAADMIAADYERLKRIAMNLEAPPPGLHVGTAYKAVELKAVDDGDRQTLLDLAYSKSSKLASIYGQEIKAFDGRDPNSPVDAIADINRIREERAAKRAKGKTVAQEKQATKEVIKSQIRKKATKETWSSFVDSITC